MTRRPWPILFPIMVACLLFGIGACVLHYVKHEPAMLKGPME